MSKSYLMCKDAYWQAPTTSRSDTLLIVGYSNRCSTKVIESAYKCFKGILIMFGWEVALQ